MIYDKEDVFENSLIEYLSTGKVPQYEINEPGQNYVIDSLRKQGRKQIWQYLSDVKTTPALWQNFKKILEQHNQDKLDGPLSENEFAQVKKEILALKTPYQAGQFLYGVNGISQIEIDLDDGRHVFLKVFDQKQVGAGDTVYQVVNQIQRPAVIHGKQERRFDTTLLINGLPIIQIEEKKDGISANEALNQMHQYIEEGQYSDIFSTVQILVAMSPHECLYMANTTADKFNKDFAFHWQRKKDNTQVNNWLEFADTVLSIPMAHQMATSYMILDGTPNNQMLKVMRPYQVYATQAVIEKLKHWDFEYGENRVGYVWHTTGSGKTITSFKTAWLASRLPNVDKVVFLVDRIALTRQTMEKYHAYDPEASEDDWGNVLDTRNTTDLKNKLRKRGSDIIVTSVQKLETLVKRDSFKDPDKNIVFIVDEAHRSTGGDAFSLLKKAFKKGAWVGYTGTPMFDDTTANGVRTKDVFGEPLHIYTIREAISDGNVLRFKVDFQTTIDEDKMKSDYLPEFYHQRYPKWTEADIKHKIENLQPDDIDDAIGPTFYDENKEHVKLVVEDIFKNWRNRSNDGQYNALLTTHVGGNRASTPMAMMYYDEFQRVNAEHQKNGGLVLKVAVTFSQSTGNDDNMVENNKNLSRAVDIYNAQFGTSFGMDDIAGYTADVVSRLNKTAFDKNYLDLVIVVDQLLTGFDAPGLNTLYVDRILRNASLIQAYSRTNRIADMQTKPFGRIVNYRWPVENEKLMNKALSIYANKSSAFGQEDLLDKEPEDNPVTVPSFNEQLDNVKKTVDRIKELTNQTLEEVPKSEEDQDELYKLLRKYNKEVEVLKQYDLGTDDEGNEIGYDYDHPEKLLQKMDISENDEKMITTVLPNLIKKELHDRNREMPDIDLRMTHIKEVVINYDYLTHLIEELINKVHEGDEEGIRKAQDKIREFTLSMDNRAYAKQIERTSRAIVNKQYPRDAESQKWPYHVKDVHEVISQANEAGIDDIIYQFRIKWGITDVINTDELKSIFANHRLGKKDLNDSGKIDAIKKDAAEIYKKRATDEKVVKLSKIKYRNSLSDAIYELADELKREN